MEAKRSESARPGCPGCFLTATTSNGLTSCRTPRAIETVTKIPAKSSNKQIADTRLPENMVGLPNGDCVSDEL